MTLKEVQQLIRTSNFRYVKILDQSGNKLALLCGSAKTPDPTADEVCAFLDRFFEDNPGAYHIEAKRWHSSPKTETFSYKNIQSPKAASPTFTPVAVDEAAIEKRLLAKWREEQKERDRNKVFLDLLAETKRKNDELDSAAGKFMHIATKILNTVIKGNPALLGMLQGAPEEKNNSMETAPLQDLKTISPENQIKINQALTLFLKHMHPELLLKFAEKVDSQPSIVPQLSTFLT